MNEKKILWTKGKVLDIENDREYDWILTKGDLILSMGIDDEKPSDYDEVFDLEDKFLMPAFIDAHGHFSANVYSFMQADLAEAKNFTDIKNIIENFIENNGLDKDEWVTAVNYDHNNLEEKDHPKKDLLDSISKTNPIALHHQSGHMGVFNTPALEKLGIDETSEQPEGGLIEKIDGAPTGYLEENAFINNIMRAPMPDSSELVESILKAQERYFSYGITVAQEGMMVKELIPLYQLMLAELDLDLDLVYYSSLEDKDKLLEAFPETEDSYQKNLKFGGLKLFLDGSPQGKTAWLREAYQGDPGNFGTSTLSDDDLYAGLKLAYDKQVQPLAHTNGDAAIEQFIDTLARLKKEGFDLAPLRPVLIHAQLLAKDQISKLKDLGIIPSFFLAHIRHWGDVHLENLGEERAEFISPAGSALDKDPIFTLHQDSPVIAPDMIETIHIAVNRRTKSGKVLGEDEKISAQEAILALTKNAAYQYFEEDSKGRLKESYKADFVVLSDNPLKIDSEKIEEIKVLKTIKGAKLVWER